MLAPAGETEKRVEDEAMVFDLSSLRTKKPSAEAVKTEESASLGSIRPLALDMSS
jgi:hypothetical protein